MSEDQTPTAEQIAAAEAAEIELDELKQKADFMGIDYHPNSKAESLRSKINAHLVDNPPPAVVPPEDDETPDDESKPDAPEEPAPESRRERNRRIKRECERLIRVRVTAMNPQLAEYKCLLFTTGNRVTGTIKKYVQFDVPTHVPAMILEQLKDAQYQTYYETKDGRGRKIKRTKLVPTYAIEMLPALTREQLHDLAQRQAMANGTPD